MSNDNVIDISDLRNSKQTGVHNSLAGKIVKSIVQPVIESGGKFSDVLVLLESVNVGVLLALEKLDNWPTEHRRAFHAALYEAVDARLTATPTGEEGASHG